MQPQARGCRGGRGQRAERQAGPALRFWKERSPADPDPGPRLREPTSVGLSHAAVLWHRVMVAPGRWHAPQQGGANSGPARMNLPPPEDSAPPTTRAWRLVSPLSRPPAQEAGRCPPGLQSWLPAAPGLG